MCLCIYNSSHHFTSLHTITIYVQITQLFCHAPGALLHNRVHASSLLHIGCMRAVVDCKLDATNRLVRGDKLCKRSYKERASQGTHNVARCASRKPVRKLPEYKPHRVQQSQIRRAENLWREGSFKEAESIFGTFASLPL